MRIFISVNLPATAQKELAKLIKKWQKFHWPVRWEKPEKIHLTLAFLGDTKTPLTKIKETVVQASRDIKSFEVGVKGLGAFPDFVRPRVVWLGLKGDLKNLARLQKQIGRIHLGQRPFVPHATIGRVKKGISKGALADLGKKIQQHRRIDFKNTMRIDSVAIMQSQLQRSGSIYKKLGLVKL